MIRRKEFKELDKNIQNAVNEVFEFAKAHEANENDYILFLARAHYEKKYEGSNGTPWLIDNASNDMFDKDRVEYLMSYLTGQYSFRDENTADSKFTITTELMLYTHIWESNRNLVNYKRLADLCNSKAYDWGVELGDDSRYEFIKEKIRDVFERHELKIFGIIKNAYRSQLRNAFAHSQYHFDLFDEPKIVFENFKPQNHPLKNIHFDEWTEVFLQSALLQKHFQNKIGEEVRQLDSGIDYRVTAIYKDVIRKGVVNYDSESMRFRGEFVPIADK